ncbi:midasin [Calliopsis andreniformis]|uniref:midasin n=1 Tax=Calliopsis andreniformis TaxID=337506 RepID=UPI003FCE251F
MLRQSITSFIERKNSYEQKLGYYGKDKVSKQNDHRKILDILSEFLMEPESTKDVAECFPQLLPALISMSIIMDKVTSDDGDAVHKLNSVVLGKLVSMNPDLLTFVVRYFDINPAPFESIDEDYSPSLKKHNRRKVSSLKEISDYELVIACYDILCSAPMHFKYAWNWSKFYKYLSAMDEAVRWVAMNCITIVLGMSESCYLSHVDNFTLKSQQFSTERKIVNYNSVTSTKSEEMEIFNDQKSVVSIAGILLPIFKKFKPENEFNLVPVPSTRRNLQNLALAVSSNKCVCLQGPVGSGKTALVDFLARATGHDVQNFAKVQLGDQTDSKMLLGMYRCTDIPGEFLWQPGILTEAVLSGKWLLLEDIDCAATDVISVIGHLVKTKTLSVPGYRDCIRVKSGFQLFVTMRSASEGTSRPLQVSVPFQKHWSCINVEPLSKEELVTVVQTLYPLLHTIATRIVDVFLLFSAGNHDDVVSNVRNTRQISTRDLIKWCSRAVVDFDVSSPVSALKIFQDALDVFCYSVPNREQRLNLAIAVAHKLGIVKTKAEYFCTMHKPSINFYKESLVIGRAKLEIHKSSKVKVESRNLNFSYTRPSVCLLERIASCIIQKEPVLLVGETGTGKTSCVQYLAQIIGRKLIVINMNQQSESTDLLGGYKPVDLKLLIFPIREEFEILFRSYFAIEPNKKFLSHVGRCFEEKRWKTLTGLMIHSTSAAIKRLKMSPDSEEKVEVLKKWENMAKKLEKLQTQVQSQYSLAFSFVEGGLVKALKNGDWVLLDEINLANAETLECLSGLLEGSCGSLSLLERGDKEPIKRHPDFAIFACMNPATDVGKKDLPIGIRNRFTEFFIDEITEKPDLQLLISFYMKDLNLSPEKIDSIVKFYLNVRKEAETKLLDGTGHKPHYSLRTLCRALTVAAQNPCGNVLRSLYEAFCLSFLTQLDSNSYPLMQRIIVKTVLGDKSVNAILGTPIPRPHNGSNENFICFEGYWILRGHLEPQIPENYILTETVKQNLKDLVRVVSIGKMPILLQGDTSVGKTSLITYLAKASGNMCVRINNHEHTDLQEYVGTYVADCTGKLVFKEGILVDAMRRGYWIILDELNLAPSDVLEALNRVLDDNRELYIAETQEVVKAHENFMLFATQNPPGLYGGRKILSRAFRNRFVELHFDEIPSKELQVILHKRCKIPESYCKQIISVMTDLQIRRKSTATFAGKKGFITLRDLFRWGERYRLAPDTGRTLYDWSQHLADEGYLVLSSKARQPEEHSEIIQVLKKHLRRDVDPDSLFSLSEKTSTVTRSILESLLSKKVPGFEHIVWTFQMRKMAVLLTKACDFKEPVLLIGETGGGKTTVCQLLSAIRQQELSIVNCHMHTEASDFLGNLRPVRDHRESQKLFEWVDGPLVKAMRNGGFFLVDEISLADDSVLERLNSLLEPERNLLIAEKPSTEENAIVSAHEDFIFVGTMNPSGDYGKKELSPALRNRFTEIWCEGVASSTDLKCIMVHNLHEEFKENVSTAIIEFLQWLQGTEIGRKLVVSVRDVLTWVNFVNSCKGLEIGDIFFHGAALSYIDGLGSGLTASENPKKFKDFKDSLLKFIEHQVQNTLKSKLTLNCEESSIENDEDKFGIHPFYIKKGNEKIPENIKFTFACPTTKKNTLKILRALQLKKPILLEGSPGVGKTSLISALARASGHRFLRINLSDQTDISDLFGADLPVEGGKPGEFSWRDGPFLRALKNGDWILLDELNLASQSVLEGLNACFDHRGVIYIPELAMTFNVKPSTRLFGCQNPFRQGGARRGLPKSFLNRFTQVFVDILERTDLQYILETQFPELPGDLLSQMITFNEKLNSEVGILWAHSGSPWEMNLRDLTRWCEATMTDYKQNLKKSFNPGKGAQLLYVDRMRTLKDKQKVIQIYQEIFSQNEYSLPDTEFPIHLMKEKILLGDEMLSRGDATVYEDNDLLLLRDQKTALRSLAQCVNMNWMTIVIGPFGSGKSSLVHLLANLAGQKLKTIAVNTAMDIADILGGFEQTDYHRNFEELLERTEACLFEILRNRLTKQNLDQVTYYHGLLENVRRLSEEADDNDATKTTTSTETKLFLRKTKTLSELVSSIRILETSQEPELKDIERKLSDLLIAVEKDKCLNAGGKFEWVDSVLVKCLQNGTWLLLDQVNLCSPAILDRLNELLEPGGVLTIGEKGVNAEGNVFSVKAHKNFRLFLTMDPRYGEISRAMRNRGVEISIIMPQEISEYNKLDIRSLLNNCGIRKVSQQDLLLRIYESVYNNQMKLNELQQVASFTSQQIARGFTLEESLKNAYREICGMFDSRSRKEALRRIDEILAERDTEELVCYDLNSISLRICDLRINSRLTMVKQQGFLLRSTVEMLRENYKEIDFQDIFQESPVTDTEKFMKLILLDFYERSSMNDLQIRHAWSSNILMENRQQYFEKLNKSLYKEVAHLEFLYKKNSAFEIPLSLIKSVTVYNNLAIALYFKLLIVEYQSQKIIKRKKDVIDVKEYSAAVCSGRLSTNLKNEPLIVRFVELIEQVAKIIDIILHSESLTINENQYIELRDSLKFFRRFYELGSIELIDKSKGTFFDLRDISSSLKVHYKWLTKLLKELFSLLDQSFNNSIVQQELTRFLNESLSVFSDIDKFRKIRKKIKKCLSIPLPHSSEQSMSFCEKLRLILKKYEVTDEDLIDSSKVRSKVSYIIENFGTRGKLIDMCVQNYQSVRNDFMELEEFTREITVVTEILDNSSKNKETVIEVEMWPIYEFFFFLFTARFQRKFCEKLFPDSSLAIQNRLKEDIPHENLFKKFEDVPTVPVHLLGLLKALNADETSLEKKISLFPELLFLTEEFSERSFAVKNIDTLLNWCKEEASEREDNSSNYEASSMNKSTLYKLIFELYLTESKTRTQTITFGNHRKQKKLLKTIQALLWRNSLVLNSPKFNISTNDSHLLQSYINYYISVIQEAISTVTLKLTEEEENDLTKRFLGPLKLLQEIKEKLKDEDDVIARGKGWLILGYLQIFVFHDLGPIDPVQKMALKSKYLRENISELELLMRVEHLQSNVLGFSLPHDRQKSRINRLEKLSAEVKDFECFQAVRPPSSFQNLREDIESFWKNIGSHETVFRQMNQMNYLAESIQRKESLSIESSKLQEAVIWKKSLQRFSKKLEKNLVGFPDLVSPLLFAVSNMSHGISILIQEVSNLESKNWNTEISYHLLRFPLIGPCQKDHLKLVKLCSSRKTAQILTKYSPSKTIERNTFQMAKIVLQELENLSFFAGTRSESLWEELNNTFFKIRILWKEQEKRKEEEIREKSSIFKTKSEAETEEVDFRMMFPGVYQDFSELVEDFPGLQGFSELQGIPEQSEKESFLELISLNDVKKVQEVHWTVLENFKRGQRNMKNFNASKGLSRTGEVNFIEPLARRFEMLGSSIETWPEKLSSKLTCTLNVLVSQKSDFGPPKIHEISYDFYRDPNIPEVEDALPLIERLSEKIEGFLEEWSENPLLNSIKLIIERILSFSIDSSLSRFLVGVELLLTKIQQWEENARFDVSLAEFIESFGEKILRWRKLEISRWKDSLEVLEENLRTQASKWWFFLFDLTDEYLSTEPEEEKEKEEEEKRQKEAIISKEKIIQNLERFLTESPLVEYEVRLQLLYLFYQHTVYHFAESKRQKELSAILWNIYNYYSRFLKDVENRLKSLKDPIARKLKDSIKITRWNDISYWSVKNTAEKTRRTLHKFVKEYQKGLQETVAAYLVLKTENLTTEKGLKKDLDPSNFLINIDSKKLKKMEKVTHKARQFCQEIIHKSNYSQIREDIEIFVEETLEESRRLRNLDQAQLKNILQQKKMALANYFKTLTQFGISYRIGILTWKNRKNEIINFASTPLDLLEMQKFNQKNLNENIEKRLIEQWSDSNKYYYESLIKLSFLDGILKSGRSDLGMQNSERCLGFSVHFTLLVHSQKEMIAKFFKYFIPIRMQVLNYTSTLIVHKSEEIVSKTHQEQDIPKQRNLQSAVTSFQELLEVLQVSLKQIMIFLETSPAESEEENLLDLNETEVPILKQNNIALNAVSSIKESLNLLQSIANEINSWTAISKRIEKSGQIFFFHRRHINFLQTSYQEIQKVLKILVDLSLDFGNSHPITENLEFLVQKITESTKSFELILKSSVEEPEEYERIEEYRKTLDKLITQILLVIQKKYQDNEKLKQEEIDIERDSVDEDMEKNLMTEKLVESLKKNVRDLKVERISQLLGHLLGIIYELNGKSANHCLSLLMQNMHLLHQYTLLLHYYLHEQVACFRLTCKFLYLQLNVFLDLATNGFCQPQDKDSSEDNQGGGTAEGGMGLADGEGQKDVSDRIESEDQLEDTKHPNQEKKDEEDKDTKEESKGIEMSENFDSHLQDLEGDEDEDKDKDKDEEEDLDKEMGETNKDAEKLDEEIWKDEEDDEEEDNGDENKEKQKEEKGHGEETGEEKLGANTNDERDNEEENEEGGRRKEEEKKEINELDDPEVNDDQIDPYHGKDQPEVEPEAFDLPEDINLDDDMNEDNQEEETNPIDIDEMKKSLPKEDEIEEFKEEEEDSKEDEKGHSSSDEDSEAEENTDMDSDKKKTEPSKNIEEDKKSDSEEEKMEEEAGGEEEKALPSFDTSSKEMDASEEVQSRKDGSKDAVQTQSSEENLEASPTEINIEDTKDKGVGQSQTQESKGHSGANQEQNIPTAGEEKSSKPIEKRRKPGQSDENRSLLDADSQPNPKKLKTALMQDELKDNEEEEENPPENGGASEVYEHIKNAEKFDNFTFDAATEEQIKQQASNFEEDEENKMDDKEETEDIEMHEEEPLNEDNDVKKEQPSKLSETKKEKSSRTKNDGTEDIQNTETTAEVEGETVDTARVSRGDESTFHTKLDIDLDNTPIDNITQKRSEIENLLSQCSQIPSSLEAANAWSSISALTESSARELSEKLRLVLEPTMTSRLKGDYRTGKRINMRKVIPYIASEFRKDKIWLRRTKPSKRNYQIVLAIDDSSSMADNHSKELAFESLSLIGKAMTYLEVGQLAVISFGERMNILHPFGENFSDESGARLIQEMKFEQKKTMVAQLLDFVVEVFSAQVSSTDNAKLVTILSDGRGIFSEGIEKVNAAVRRAKLLNIFLVFIIVDNPMNKDSILDIRMPVFENGKLLNIRSYMDNFPFPFYIILRDLSTLPAILSDALRQWFEIVGRIDV